MLGGGGGVGGWGKPIEIQKRRKEKERGAPFHINANILEYSFNGERELHPLGD